MFKYIKKNNKLLKITIIMLSLLFIIFLYFFLKNTRIIEKLYDISELKKLIQSSGFWSYTIFAFLQFFQVTILPLPASITTIVGTILFGPFTTFLLSSLSIILGSIFAYILGRIFGFKLLKIIIKKDKLIKLQEKLKKGNFIFFIMMLFPFFPDDILCILAGTIKMDFKTFLIINLITRPIGLFCICYFGSGLINSLNPFGIYIWPLLFLSIIILYFIFNKFKKILFKKEMK